MNDDGMKDLDMLWAFVCGVVIGGFGALGAVVLVGGLA